MMKKTKKKTKKKAKKPPNKNKGGRPTKYKPECVKQARILAEKGFTDEGMAEVFGVTEQTINNWKKEYPGFFESLKKGKGIADSKVERSLYERACGYSHPDIHFSSYEGDITKTAYIKYYPPEPVACFFWLKNRRPDKWRDKTETMVIVKHPEPITVEQAKKLLEDIEKAGTGIDTDI